MKKNIRIIACLLSAALMVSLAACGDKKEEPKPETSSVPAESPSVTSTAKSTELTEETTEDSSKLAEDTGEDSSDPAEGIGEDSSEAPSQASSAKETVFTFTVENETGKALSELYLYPDGSASSGQNLLEAINAGKPLQDGESITVPSAAIDYGSNDPLIVNYTLAYTAEDQTSFQYDGIAADDCILLLMADDLDIQ